MESREVDWFRWSNENISDQSYVIVKRTTFGARFKAPNLMWAFVGESFARSETGLGAQRWPSQGWDNLQDSRRFFSSETNIRFKTEIRWLGFRRKTLPLQVQGMYLLVLDSRAPSNFHRIDGIVLCR